MSSTNDGIRKAAILAGSLDTAATDKLLDQMSPDQARLVRQAMIELDEIDPAEQQRVIDEFLQVGPTPVKQDVGLELDDRLAGQLSLRPDARPNEPPFCFLHGTDDGKLADVLKSERPQAVALVLSHLPPEQAGKVLGRLPATMQTEVVRRLVELEETDPRILEDVEQVLRSRFRFSSRTTGGRRRSVGLPAMAGILKASSRETGFSILDNVAAHDRELAERIGPRSVDFQELSAMGSSDWAVVVDAADREELTLALIGTPPNLIERILRDVPPAGSRADPAGTEPRGTATA